MDIDDSERTTPVDGRSTRWIAHRVRRRALLLEQARAVLPGTGAEVAMDELASAMGTSKSILYRYFEDRSGLSDALAALVTAELRERIAAVEPLDGRTERALAAILRVYLELVVREPDLYLFISATAGEHPRSPDAEAGEVADDGPHASPYEWAVLEALGAPFDAMPAVRRAAAVGTLRGAVVRWLDESGVRTQDGPASVGDAPVRGFADELARWVCEGVVESPPRAS